MAASEIEVMICRGFGSAARVREAVELGGGMWNTTLRVRGEGLPDADSVIVRVAPAPEKQTANERDLMRTEHAVLPFLAALGGLVPRLLFADFTHQVLPRDYLIQTVLPGVPAPEALVAGALGVRAGFYRRLGEITCEVHSVAGAEGFGRVGGQLSPLWSERILREFSDLAADAERAGLDAADLRQVAALCARHAEVLDVITSPRLALGDLWVLHCATPLSEFVLSA